jgi:hypothetical protein
MERGETEQAARAHRRYVTELAGSMAAYVTVLLAVIPFVRDRPASPWALPVGLLPLVPIGLLLWVLVRHYGRVDEMARRTIVESMALAFGVSAPIVITLGFLETAGLELSIWWAWVSMGGAWAVGALALQHRFR